MSKQVQADSINAAIDGPYYELGQIEDLTDFDPSNDESDKLIRDQILGDF